MVRGVSDCVVLALEVSDLSPPEDCDYVHVWIIGEVARIVRRYLTQRKVRNVAKGEISVYMFLHVSGASVSQTTKISLPLSLYTCTRLGRFFLLVLLLLLLLLLLETARERKVREKCRPWVGVGVTMTRAIKQCCLFMCLTSVYKYSEIYALSSSLSPSCPQVSTTCLSCCEHLRGVCDVVLII